MLALALAASLGLPSSFAPQVTAVRVPAIFSMPWRYRRCGCGRQECTVILCMKCCREIHLCTCKARA